LTLAPESRVTQDDAAGAQTPSLAVIDAAIMQAATVGDAEHRNALMALRVTVVLADLIGALADALTAEGARP